ncbi:DNA-directed RNA polymerase III subunit RPC4 [Cryptococcus bacillisporus CA1873]|uniref:DNA-directed RNA polymerase III subunit RPC4 n=1 Tax=Cryptococcus bacillisporus CA1873 TaxID=1296111 RepID=A0ABR5BAK3_CRYGA|nr:DNA-directed RNA polymerase III subunit RPC4 [Cryptococcus bacillisporus CA1873]|eukprot:KIR60245.1 DNA-directed RNA polymerase III subunit RPC4 [Cryptococcus gattii CA1873]
MSNQPPPALVSAAMHTNRSTTVSETSAPSARSTPGPSAGPSGESAPAGGIQRMKFKPKVPIRRVKTEAETLSEPALVTQPPARGGINGRGRGGGTRGRGRGGAVVSTSIAAGVFGGPRPAASSSRRFTAAAPAPRTTDYPSDAEVYSDHSEEDGFPSLRPIDIDMVSTMSESAPTSLYRDRKLTQGKTKGEKDKKDVKSRAAKKKNKEKNEDSSRGGVKDEPMSPSQRERDDDAMMSGDEEQDRDERGRRVRNFMQTGGIDEPEVEEVNAAQAVDLSESESEDEEENLKGDFISIDGNDAPENKLFIFQFPHLFPKFHPAGPVDLTNPDGDMKPDIKPTAAQLRAKKNVMEPTPEGRVGTMVVMKSGKVKIVMGKDIVMNVNPGVPATFVQQLVHLEAKQKSAIVLGDVHKNYVVTPDIDLLLQDLYSNGGQTPGDKEVEARVKALRMRGLVKMEDH